MPPSKDLFSGHSADYSRFRPTYPETLFEWCAEQSPARNAAWDCATGNGQAAVPLARRFGRVFATDLSEKQLAEATRAPGVDYRVGTAEASGLEPTSVDLVTAAQALHWFDHVRFAAEVRRVARPGALLAVWSYGLSATSPEVDRVMHEFYEMTGPFWEPERQMVDDGYRGISLPFTEVPAPALTLAADWSQAQLLGYVGTWSGLRTMRVKTGRDPIAELTPALARAWAGAPTRRVTWPLALRAFRVS